ncbi:SCO family protein [Tabrizicola soli]|uniref:SCO family protein n=1 Tax=Tabrizicola soli TaxID=2185115 RepID=A0ABV7DYT3_9RHOB|nr:SCO family protein [Tabrizicola soli]
MGVLRNACLAACLLAVAPAARADTPRLDAETAYGQSQAAIGGRVSEHVLTDHNGQPLALADLRGKPLVVSLVYTSCATVCPITTDYLREQVVTARRAVGDGFGILTFGFDASGDRPAQLAAFAGTHDLTSIDGWRIASADPETTTAFLEELGFSYATLAGSFEHVTQTTILDADGTVYRQVYGEAFPPQVLIQPLKELVLGTHTRSLAPQDLWNRINFLCTVYNPLTGAYRFDYGIFFGIFFGAASLLLTGFFILRLWLERRRALRSLRGRNEAAS